MIFADASEAIDRMWFIARENNLPYTALDAIEEIAAAVDMDLTWHKEKEKLESELYDMEEKAAKFEEKALRLERENDLLQERIEELESAP